MQNLPKIKTKKATSFKSSFLENLTKDSKILTSNDSQNDTTLMKVNSYDISNSFNSIAFPNTNSKINSIKKGFKKFFSSHQNPEELQMHEEKKSDGIDLPNKEKVEENMMNNSVKKSNFPKIEALDFKKYLGNKLEERRMNIFGKPLIKIFPNSHLKTKNSNIL